MYIIFFLELDGGIGIAEMLYRCNIMALVGGGEHPKYLTNKVIIWDDHQKKVISELKFSTEVKSVRMRKDKYVKLLFYFINRIIVICEQKIFVFDFNKFQDLDIIDTFENPKGIVALSYDPNKTVLAYPADKTKGYVRVKCYETNTTSLINAHESGIAYIALNKDGSLLATASDKGTLIRIFQSSNGLFLQEVRRGKDKAEIECICFDSTSKLLGVSSNKGTIHIFSLTSGLKKMKAEENGQIEEEKEEGLPQNHVSIFKGLPNFLTGGFFKSEWSFAQVRINEENAKITFINNNTLVAITPKGHYYKVEIDLKKGGEGKIIEKSNLFDNENSS